MSILPESLTALSADGRPAEGAPFKRVDPFSPEGRRLSEANWDDIICANVTALADALRAAEIIAADCTLRVLGRQVEAVDVLLAEVRARDDESLLPDPNAEPRRLVLLEDKLVRNPQAKREVLAQILDYAQRAQREWTVDTLCRRVGAEDAMWLRSHSARIDVMLAQGELLLIIAGDDIDGDLLQLARRFVVGGNPLSLAELCLVSMAVYRRGDERLLIPHVVSAVERHQRQLSIRVTVKSESGEILPARIEPDPEADTAAARRGALLVNPDVEAFLAKAKAILDRQLLGPDSPYAPTGAPARKSLVYWLDDAARLKIHFGGFPRDVWSPIHVGLYVESREKRDEWARRVEAASAAGKLPVGTRVRGPGRSTVEALKFFDWSTPADLTQDLLDQIIETLLTFEQVFGTRALSG